MDLFDVAAKITLDADDFLSGIADAADESLDLGDALQDMQTKYNQASAEVSVLQKALNEYVAETGSATGAGEELAAMLAEKQIAAADAKESVDALKAAIEDEANSSSEAASETHSFGEIVSAVAKTASTAFDAVSSAILNVVGHLAGLISDTADYGNTVDKMSQKMGMSNTAYQEWDAVMEHMGTSMSTMKTSMRTLANAAETNNDAFAKLGMTQSEIASMNQEELFSATIAALQNVEDTTERTYLAGQLLGRGATELGPLLNKSAEETEAMKQRVHELGGVMSDEAVAASAQFADNMQDLKTSISGIGRNLSAEFLPGINDVIAGLTSLIIGEEGAQEKIVSGMTSVASAVTTVIPQITEIISSVSGAFIQMAPELVKAGTQLLKSLLTSLFENTAEIVDAATSIVETLINGIADVAPLLITGAFALISELTNSLGEALPTLLPTVVNMVMQMALALTDPSGLAAILNGALSLMQGLANGILAALPTVINTIPVLIQNLIDFIVQNLPQFLVQGTQIIVQLAVGIIQAIPSLLEQLPVIVESIINGLVELAPQLLEAGKTMAKEVWNGIKSIFGGGKQEQVDVSSSFDFNTVGTEAQQTASTVSTAFSGMNTSLDLSAASTSATTQFNAISTSATAAKDSVVNSFTGMGTEIGTAVASSQGNVDWSALESGATTAAENMKAAFEDLPNQMKAIWEQIKSTYNEVPSWFSKVFTAAYNNIMSKFGQLPTQFSIIWNNIKNDAKTSGADMVTNFTDGMNTAVTNKLVPALQGMAQTVSDYVQFSEPKKGPLSNFHTSAPDMIDLFAKGLKDSKNTLVRAVSDTFDIMDVVGRNISPAEYTFSDVVSTHSVSARSALDRQNDTDRKMDAILSLLGQYLPGLSNQTVVLDSGELVGAMLPRVDAGLGQSVRYKARGNA